ncbi:MAG: hypothetical protein LAP40_01180 [Acidobacteriia bacterium]|nr:hypothetical protein [Terriglobia bacterium]
MTDWPYDDTLDALIADPAHHKLVMQNERVRVLETIIPAGAHTAVHTHRWPSVLYMLSVSDFLRYDDRGAVITDSRTQAQPTPKGGAVYVPPMPPHSVQNIGSSEIRMINVEWKD